ncbi:MAG: KilA-N domain-containing protein [Burkholderiales bacterium]
MAKIDIKGTSVTVISGRVDDYISLTNIAPYKDSDPTVDLIRNWLRNRSTIEFLGIWEQLNNPDFNPVEFDGVGMQSGRNHER